jgi:hypothetical protein
VWQTPPSPRVWGQSREAREAREKDNKECVGLDDERDVVERDVVIISLGSHCGDGGISNQGPLRLIPWRAASMVWPHVVRVRQPDEVVAIYSSCHTWKKLAHQFSVSRGVPHRGRLLRLRWRAAAVVDLLPPPVLPIIELAKC